MITIKTPKLTTPSREYFFGLNGVHFIGLKCISKFQDDQRFSLCIRKTSSLAGSHARTLSTEKKSNYITYECYELRGISEKTKNMPKAALTTKCSSQSG